MKPKLIMLQSSIKGFIDDKDEAKRIRTNTLIPALEKHHKVVIDFGNVNASTQSFVHALVGEALVRFREPALENLEFRNCSSQIKSLIELVVDYSLGGFTSPPEKHGPNKEKKEKALA